MPELKVKNELGAWLTIRGDAGPRGIQGIQGPPGPIGPDGPQGEVGQGIRVRWVVAAVIDLPSVGVELGDGALVGGGAPYTLYVYANNPTPMWNNAGYATTPLAGSGSANTAARSDHDHLLTYSQISHVHDAAGITTGTLSADRIPGLDGSKITTGMVASARIAPIPTTQITGVLPADQVANIDASKVTTGTLASSQVPGLAASKITSGELDLDRLPRIPASKIGTGTFTESQIPNLSANKITSGTLAKARIPVQAISELFPTNATSNSYSTSSMRIAPGNFHAAIGTLGSGIALHDTGWRRTTDEAWAYVMIPDIGFCWIPANRL